MNALPYQSCNLNIWCYLPQNIWAKVPLVYEQMPGWIGFIEDGESSIPHWFGCKQPSPMITASVEPSGLLFEGQMLTKDFEKWITLFKHKATEILRFKVGEIELGEVSDEIEWMTEK